MARVCGTANERMISSGARGRGMADGNASAALVNTDVNCDGCEQSTAPRASHASSSNCRSAENRLCEPLSAVGSGCGGAASR